MLTKRTIAIFSFCVATLLATSQNKTLRIGLIIDSPEEQENVFRDVIQEEIQTLLRIEYNLEFDSSNIKYADWDIKNVPPILDAYLSDPDIDLILGIGVLSSDVLARNGPFEKPVLASIVIDHNLQNIPITPEGTSGNKNLNYTLSPYKPSRDLDKFYEIYPYKNVGILMQRDLVEGIGTLQQYFNDYFSERPSEFTLLIMDQDADEALNQIDAGQYDAIYLGAIFSVQDPGEVQKLIDGINARKLPSLALAGSDYCSAGVMASMAPRSNMRRIARRIAVNIQNILDKVSPEELPVNLRYREEFTINMATVRQIDFYPSWDVLSQATLLNEDNLAIETQWNMLAAIQEALNANLDLQIEYLAVDAGMKDIDAAKSNLLPQVGVSALGRLIDKDRADASFGSAPEWATTLSGQVDQLLFSEEARANVDIQRGLQETRIAELDVVTMDLVKEVAESYLNILRAKTIVSIQRENLSLNRRNLELARVRNEVGYSGPSDLYRWESSIAQARTSLNDAEATMRIAKMNLNRLMNKPISEEFLTEEVSLADNYIITNDQRLFRYIDNPAIFKTFSDFMVQEGLRNLPEINQLNAGIGIQERVFLLNERSFYAPTIGLQASIDELLWKAGAGSSGDPSIPGISKTNNLTWTVGLSASLPIFTGFQRKAASEKAKIELEQLRTEQLQLNQFLEQRVRISLEETAASYTNIALNFQARDAARKNLDLVQDAYSKGIVSVIQLIDAQNATIQAEQGAANAVYEFVIDLINMERSVGNFYSLSSETERNAYFERLETFVNQN